MLELLEGLGGGGLEVVPGGFAGGAGFGQELGGLLGLGLQGGHRLLVSSLGLGGGGGAGLGHLVLVLLDLRLPDRDLALELLGEVLLDGHGWPPLR